MESTQEIRREKVFVSPDVDIKKLMKKFGISETTARNSKKKGFFVKNYMTPQVIIDRENFNPEVCYSIAKQIFWKRFRKNPVAVSIKDDLIQQGVEYMFKQSGKAKEGATEKYNEHYQYYWICYNAMIAFLNTWIRQTKYDVELQDEIHPYMTHGNRYWSPEYGWQYC